MFKFGIGDAESWGSATKEFITEVQVCKTLLIFL
jgi:hypothetical protein